MVVLLFAWASPAAADLYRWVDPETGSVKFSSYPPPWFGDAAKQRRAPKVEVIPPGKSVTAFEPTPGVDRERAADPAADAPRGDRRGTLLKLLAQRVGALVTAAPDATERAYVAIAESLQELEQQEKQSKPANSKEEAARLEEKWQLAGPLEAHRIALSQRISGLRPPPPGATPEAVANAWRGTQLQVSALEWTNEALMAIDPRKANARHFEMRSLTEKVAEMWEPYVGRRDLGR
jgi:hypothetical protein